MRFRSFLKPCGIDNLDNLFIVITIKRIDDYLSMPRKRQFDESDILNKSMMLFWEKGYAGSSMKDIEKCLGLTPPSIYNAYGNKLGLFEKTISFYINQVVHQRIQEFLTSKDDVLKGLHSFFTSVIEGADKTAPGAGCLLTNTSLEPDQVSGAISILIKETFSHIRDALKQQITLLQKQKMLCGSLDAEMAADNLLVNYQGMLVVVRLGYSQQQLQQYAETSLAYLTPYLINKK